MTSLGRVRRVPVLAGVTLLLANVLILTPNSFVLQSLAALVLAGLLPGFLLVDLLFGQDTDTDIIEKLVLGIGIGYVCILLGTLALHYCPGPLTRKLVVVSYDMLALGLILLRFRQRSHCPTQPLPPRYVFISLAAIIIVAGLFRFLYLGYSEFQGDEVAILHTAAESIQGHDDALFYHRKGPAEILLPTLSYAVSRRMSESVGRIPFALANLTGMLGLYVIGRRFFSHRAGWWAALLIGLNGFYVAFGRIIQYQSLVFLFGALGLLCALRFVEKFDRRDLWLTAIFAAMGLLAHTDAAFAVVAAAFVILRAFWDRHLPLREVVRRIAGPALVSGAVLATFYIPFVVHPQFRATQTYFMSRLGQPPYNNFNDFLRIGTVYNAVYYLALPAVGVTGLVLRRLGRISRPRWLLPLLCMSLLAVSWLFPGLWRVGERDFVGALFLAIALGLTLGRDRKLAWEAALLWFGLPFLLYLFWFRDPRTHFYILFPGASLLLGVELDNLSARLGRRTWLLNGLCAAVLVISAAYLYIMFVSHTPEYRRTYPAHRIPFFWVPYGDDFPKHGLFGFPYRAGWKVVGHLYSSGELQGSYNSNEESHITRWYTRGEQICTSHPDYYFLAKNVQDVQSVPMDEIRSDYELIGRVWVGDEAKLRMYERKPVQQDYSDFHLSEIASLFDRDLTDPDYDRWLVSFEQLAELQYPAQLRLGSNIGFLGHSVDKTQMLPGEVLTLTLYWRALSPITESYTVFTHIEDPGALWGQQDNIPGCGSRLTNKWDVGRVYADQYALVLSLKTPPGPHALVAGMYRFDTGERLPVTDATGAPLGNTLNLGTIEVVAP